MSLDNISVKYHATKVAAAVMPILAGCRVI
jgi:hypothetical protein